MIREEKTDRWKTYVEEIDGTTNLKKMWSMLRNLEGKRPPDKKNEVLEVNGIAYVENRDKRRQNNLP